MGSLLIAGLAPRLVGGRLSLRRRERERGGP